MRRETKIVYCTVIFTVFAYLALFRLEELGIEHFKKFVNTQLPQKMHKVNKLGTGSGFLNFNKPFF